MVGTSAAIKLAEMFGGERVELPKPPPRRTQILALRAAGRSVEEIARALSCTRRRVFQVLAEARRERLPRAAAPSDLSRATRGRRGFSGPGSDFARVGLYRFGRRRRSAREQARAANGEPGSQLIGHRRYLGDQSGFTGFSGPPYGGRSDSAYSRLRPRWLSKTKFGLVRINSAAAARASASRPSGVGDDQNRNKPMGCREAP